METLSDGVKRPEDSESAAISPDVLDYTAGGGWFQQDEPHARRLKFIERMAARIAHEVRNPVASIRLNMEMIEAELEHITNKQSRKEAFELLKSVGRELDRLEAIAGAYLKYGSIPKLRLEKCSLHCMLQELQDFMKREMKKRKIEFVNEFSADIPDIVFDKDRLKEAVLNVYKNAADAMPDGGEIRTCTLVSDARVEIRISDTGVGIPADDADKLFEPFFSGKALGTGLGLTISRDILSAHGGTILFHSREGDLTTFVLALPIRR